MFKFSQKFLKITESSYFFPLNVKIAFLSFLPKPSILQSLMRNAHMFNYKRGTTHLFNSIKKKLRTPVINQIRINSSIWPIFTIVHLGAQCFWQSVYKKVDPPLKFYSSYRSTKRLRICHMYII